nr:HT027 [Homo sapiens]
MGHRGKREGDRPALPHPTGSGLQGGRKPVLTVSGVVAPPPPYMHPWNQQVPDKESGGGSHGNAASSCSRFHYSYAGVHSESTHFSLVLLLDWAMAFILCPLTCPGECEGSTGKLECCLCLPSQWAVLTAAPHPYRWSQEAGRVGEGKIGKTGRPRPRQNSLSSLHFWSPVVMCL